LLWLQNDLRIILIIETALLEGSGWVEHTRYDQEVKEMLSKAVHFENRSWMTWI